MLVKTTTILAFRCDNCGRTQYQPLSLFAFGRGETIHLQCQCGQPIMQVNTKDRRNYFFQLDCPVCEGKHLYQYRLADLLSLRTLVFECGETGLEMAYLGTKSKVRKAITKQERSLREMAEDLGFGDYFDNPEVMYRSLDRLHEIAEGGGLSCHCGNLQIEVEIFPDRVALRCPSCGAVGTIPAVTEEDYDKLKKTGEITLMPDRRRQHSLGKDKPSRRHSKK